MAFHLENSASWINIYILSCTKWTEKDKKKKQSHPVAVDLCCFCGQLMLCLYSELKSSWSFLAQKNNHTV